MGGTRLPEPTAWAMLDTVAARHPGRQALVFGNDRTTFAGLRDRARAFAGGLAALGLGKGDALAIWLPNRPLWFVAQYAAASLGVVVVALNPRYRAFIAMWRRMPRRAANLIGPHIVRHLG